MSDGPAIRPVSPVYGESQELHLVPKLPGKGHIQLVEVGDALHIDTLQIRRHTVCQAGHQRQLMSRVDTLDVQGGVGLGVSEVLSLGKRLAEARPFLSHLREDVIAGAVEDAVDEGVVVGDQCLAERLDDRYAAPTAAS